MKKISLLTSATLLVILSSETFVSAEVINTRTLVAQSPSSVTDIFTVTGGSDAGKIGKDSPLKRDVDPKNRSVHFKLVSFGRKTAELSKTWVVIHGWNDNSNDGGDLNKLARTIASKNPNDRVLMLDWSEASNNCGEFGICPNPNINRGNYYAATWIRPVAEAAVKKLRELGINDQEASQNLNLVGHSLGAIMSAEIGAIYKDSQSKNRLVKQKDKVGVNSIIALDPASELNADKDNPLGLLYGDLGGYDVDGRTPAYVPADGEWNGKLFTDPYGSALFIPNNGEPSRQPKSRQTCSNNNNLCKNRDAPKDFNQAARFSRAFVGRHSVAGNQKLASTAHESFQMDFGGLTDNLLDLEHSRVVKAFTKMVSNPPFDGFFGANDLGKHKNLRENAYAYKKSIFSDEEVYVHEGRIDVNKNIEPYALHLSHITEGSLIVAKDGVVFRDGLPNASRDSVLGNISNFFGNILNVTVGSGIRAGELGTSRNLFPNNVPDSTRNAVSPRTIPSKTTVYYSPSITFKLGASEGCTNTGINVSKNQVIKFSATGEASYGYEGSPVNAYPTTNPNGDRLVNGVNIGAKNDPNAIYPGPIGALVGKIDSSHHSGNYFLIGSNNQISMAKSGRLIVCYNEVDGQFGNNTGFYTVSIYKQIVSGSSSKPSSSAGSTVTSRKATLQRINHSNATEIPFEICSTSKTWVRPKKAEQIRKLQSMKRFGDVTREPARSDIESWWTHNIISFTSYGGSAFYDYGYLSGLWTGRDYTPWKCGSNYAVALNSGEIARVWVLLHKVIKIKWQGNRYVMVVKPTGRGVQVIQLSRREHQNSLPLAVVTENGTKLEILVK